MTWRPSTAAGMGRLLPVGDNDRSPLGPGAVHSTVSDMVTHTEAVLRAGRAEGTDPAAAERSRRCGRPVQPGSQDRGDGVGIFLHDFDGLRVVGHDRNLPRFAFALLSADGQIGAVVLSTTATLFGAPSARRGDLMCLCPDI
ncbi:MAG TPA: hypothetical protein VJ301_07095 [Propionibacteriaceae bacterium]|nr:hypothetical protein [Propionibacteriaceae bacterium]